MGIILIPPCRFLFIVCMVFALNQSHPNRIGLNKDINVNTWSKWNEINKVKECCTGTPTALPHCLFVAGCKPAWNYTHFTTLIFFRLSRQMGCTSDSFKIYFFKFFAPNFLKINKRYQFFSCRGRGKTFPLSPKFFPPPY